MRQESSQNQRMREMLETQLEQQRRENENLQRKQMPPQRQYGSNLNFQADQKVPVQDSAQTDWIPNSLPLVQSVDAQPSLRTNSTFVPKQENKQQHDPFLRPERELRQSKPGDYDLAVLESEFDDTALRQLDEKTRQELLFIN
jgi:hypothetical protein